MDSYLEISNYFSVLTLDNHQNYAIIELVVSPNSLFRSTPCQNKAQKPENLARPTRASEKQSKNFKSMKKRKEPIVKLIGKTGYGKQQIKKHGQLWFVLQIVDTSMEILAKHNQLEYKWIDYQNGKHYDVVEYIPEKNNGKKKKPASAGKKSNSSREKTT